MGKEREVSCQEGAISPSFTKEMRTSARPRDPLHPAIAQLSHRVQITSSQVHFFPIHQQIVPIRSSTAPRLITANRDRPTQQGQRAVSQEQGRIPSVLRLIVIVAATLTTLKTTLNYNNSHQL